MMEVTLSSCILILAVILLRWVFRKRISQRLQYGVWLVVALRLLIPVQLGSASFSVGTVVQRNPQAAQVQAFVRRPVTQAMTDPVPSSQDAPAPDQADATSAAKAEGPTVGQLLWGIYLAGAGAAALWFLGTNLQYRRHVAYEAQPIAAPESPIPVWVSAQAPSPCLVGLFRPAIYLTPACAADPVQRRHVLTHELTHLRHRDPLWAYIRCICLCLHWFNPLVWVAAALSRKDCELACDEGALRRLPPQERLAYGKTLVQTAELASMPARLMQTATSMGESKEQIKERITRIARRPRTLLTAGMCMLLVVALAAGCTFVGAKAPEKVPNLPDLQPEPATQPIAPLPSETTPEPEPVTEPEPQAGRKQASSVIEAALNAQLSHLPAVETDDISIAAQDLSQQVSDGIQQLLPQATVSYRPEDVRLLWWDEVSQFSFGLVLYLAFPPDSMDEETQKTVLGSNSIAVSQLPQALRESYPEDPNGYLSYRSFLVELAQWNIPNLWRITQQQDCMPIFFSNGPLDNRLSTAITTADAMGILEEAQASGPEEAAVLLSEKIFQTIFEGPLQEEPLSLADWIFRPEGVQILWSTDRFVSFQTTYAIKPTNALGWSSFMPTSDIITPWDPQYSDYYGYLGYWKNILAGRRADGTWIVLDMNATGWPSMDDFSEEPYLDALNRIPGGEDLAF